MQTQRSRGFRFCAVMLIVVQLAGCGASNLGTGMRKDKSSSHQDAVPSWKVKKLEPGTRLFIILKNGDTLSGSFVGFTGVPPEVTAESYDKLRLEKPEGIFLPAAGENVKVSDNVGKEFTCQFLAFDYLCMSAKREKASKVTTIPLNTVTRISDSQGNTIRGVTIRNLISENKIPLLSDVSTISIEREISRTQISPTVSERVIDTTQISWESISSIRKPATGRVARLVLLAGVAIVGTFFLLRLAMGHWDWDPIDLGIQ